ncbi:pimeloyl-ACP methyl ester carboxylesterase [Lentzea atacamensis]|uniref:Pimeloyl-ACP methyl ester carboxylesterase n=2 Tax=Lentzea atacamensis TaxID=531938 RepID=A0ABX9ECN2_9PSEU|nr:pimeloyl-ACP methyl ester carboxylesterase [Lentzea atacamensis]
MSSLTFQNMNVIIHGAQSVAADWDQVKALLEPAAVPERRGRSGVPLPDDHSLRTEVEDLHEVLDQHKNATLVGHSYGGLIALLAAQERDDLEALVLYEPALHVDSAKVASFRHALSRGDRDLALEIMVTEIAGEQQFRDTDPEGWLKAQELLETTSRELATVESFRYQPPKLQVPVTVIVGEHTDHIFGPAARDVVRDTGGTLVTLEGEGHIAHVTNPELLAATIRNGSSTLST